MRHMGDGSVTRVVAWSRSERWRFSRAARHLPRPSCPSPTTERCRWAIAVTHSRDSPAGARVLLEGAISGRTAGERSSWLVAFHNGSVRAGSPVVNESGAPGPGRQPDSPVRSLRARDELRGTPLVSFADMKVPESAAAVPLDNSAYEESSCSGSSARLTSSPAASRRRSAAVRPSRPRSSGASSPRTKDVDRIRDLESPGTAQRHDVHEAVLRRERLISQSKPQKSDLKKQNLVLVSWQMPMLRTPGVYRAAVLMDDKVMWRGYVRLLP